MNSPAQAINTPDLQAVDAAHHMHPFTNGKELNAKGARVIERAEGVWLWDSEGNKILDGMGGLWCVNIGYGRNELAEVAAAQMRQLPYYNTFFSTTHQPVVELAELVASIAPEHMNRVFFTNSGSESNDTVIRMVRHYWASRGKPEKKVIISRWNAYHGSTVAAASLGGMKPMHAQGGLPIPDVEHIRQPHWFDEGGDMSREELGQVAAQALEDKILEMGEGRVAAFIAEPIQGAGGVVVPPENYWPEVKKILAKYEILLVADEVICGFGRTGEWFGADYYDLKPDLMPIAKGLSSGYLPIGGVIVADHVAKVLDEQGGEFNHGYTYSGHPVAAAVAAENIRIIQREGIVERVRDDIGPYLQKQWATLGDHPLVGETRGLGMFAALEICADKATRKRFEKLGTTGGICRDFCNQNNLVMRAVYDTMIISPPLTMTHAEVDELVARARRALDQTAEAIGS